MNLNHFIALWTHPDYPPDAVSAKQIERAERRLRTRLPADYRDGVVQFGLPRPTIDLLDAIVDQELALRDVGDFLSPSGMVSTTKNWRKLGLSKELVTFATDCMGNLFCFPTSDVASEEAPVFFFDHDAKTMEMIAPSFMKWIDEFCKVTP